MAVTPEILLTGARGRICQSVLPFLCQYWQCATVGRSDSPHTSIPHTNWNNFFANKGTCPAKTVLHLAWSSSPSTAETQADLISQDLDLVDKLASHLHKYSPKTRLFFFSSGSVYGNTEHGPATENSLLRPNGKYAEAKVAAEKRLHFWQQQGLAITILRVANPYGIASRPEDAQGVIPHLIRHALAGTTFPQWGENPVKDYLYIEDFHNALKLALEHQLLGTWNISTGKPTSLSYLKQQVEKITQKPILTDQHPKPSWDSSPNVLDPSKFEQATNWQANISLQEGLQKIISTWAKQANTNTNTNTQREHSKNPNRKHHNN